MHDYNDNCEHDKFIMIDDAEPIIKTSTASDVDWARSVMSIDKIWNYTRGAGITVGVVDSGIPKHNDLEIHAAHGKIDKLGHATHVCGIIASKNQKIYGLAPECKIVVYQGLDNYGCGNYGDIIDGILWCIEQGAHIINLSLGAAHKPNHDDLNNLLSIASETDAVIIAATGNSGDPIPNWPARAYGVIAVGAITHNWQRAPWSNAGHDVLAPGIVNSTYGTEFATMRGTSQAAALVTATTALLMGFYQMDSATHDVILGMLREISIMEIPIPNLIGA